MRKIILTASSLACAIALAALLAACKADDAGHKTTSAQTSAPTQAATSPEAARRITVAELQQKLEEGEVVIYDTRPKSAYDTEHIKGSLLMPYSDVAGRAGELPKDKLIVFYCT